MGGGGAGGGGAGSTTQVPALGSSTSATGGGARRGPGVRRAGPRQEGLDHEAGVLPSDPEDATGGFQARK